MKIKDSVHRRLKAANVWISLSEIVDRQNKNLIEIDKRWKLGRIKIRFHYRSANHFWGRFGGGWQWELGFRASSWRSINLMLLIAELSIHIPKEAKNEN
jgi:hypothetical protein